MELKLTDSKNKKLEVDSTIFDCSYNEGLIHQVVVSFLAKARSGNSAQKTRAEVRGGGIKPWRQKGTGRARAGTIRSPLWRKGGVVFAAKPRDYSKKVNRKMYRKAICSILSELIRHDRLIVLEKFDCEVPKTKSLIAKLNELKLENVLLICEEVSENLYLAARNLFKVGVIDVAALDPVSLLNHEKVLITATALKQLEEQLSE